MTEGSLSTAYPTFTWDQESKWMCLVPVANVDVTPRVRGRFRIVNVLLVRAKSLIDQPSRFGLRLSTAELRKIVSDNQWGGDAAAVAIARQRGKGTAASDAAVQIVRQELLILASSSFGRATTTRLNNRFGVLGEVGRSHIGVVMHDPERGHRFSSHVAIDFLPFRLDEWWRERAELMSFPQLLGILRGDVHVTSDWCRTLKRVALLAGASVNATDRASAFLNNMIAIEILLIDQGDKAEIALCERSRALFDWDSKWPEREAQIHEVYQLRCGFVHRAADLWLANLIRNFARFPGRFSRKQDVKDFASALQGRELLKRYRPHRRGFKFIESRLESGAPLAARDSWRW